MRLLNTKTLALHNFIGQNIPTYAILSHRWEENEVTFTEFEFYSRPTRPSYVYSSEVLGPPTLPNVLSQGWKKILNFAEVARDHGYEYAWIDTCCIDSRSSAELSEAINAMYTWYRRSDVCYVYLSDVTSVRKPEFQDNVKWRERGIFTRREVQEERKGSHAGFRASKWFTRGWTLQELLAPDSIVFYSRYWEVLGTLDELEALVSDITNIPLHSTQDISTFCVAQRMSWAAKRKTTREEDSAYCLMGIFDVNMPLLYGEGAKKAFRRLQMEIMQHSLDDSIFAWDGTGTHSGLLADSPLDFANSGDIYTTPNGLSNISNGLNEIQMTSRGLRVTFNLTPFRLRQNPKLVFFVAPLSCSKAEGFIRRLVCVVLYGETNHPDGNVYCRVGPLYMTVFRNGSAPSWKTIYVRDFRPSIIIVRLGNNLISEDPDEEVNFFSPQWNIDMEALCASSGLKINTMAGDSHQLEERIRRRRQYF